MLATSTRHADPLAKAIERAQQNLLRLQHTDGHWCGELFVDCTLVSDYVCFMHWAGEVDSVLQEKCVAHVLRRQLPDGGWNTYEGGPSEINASVKAYFVLKLAGNAPTKPFMQEARAAILRLGGIPRMNTYSKLYLALLGQFPWKNLPTVPVEIMLMPRWLFFNLYEMSSWTRAMLVPLSILNHFKPTRTLAADIQLHELYPIGAELSDLRPQWQRPRLSWPNFFLVCDRILKSLSNMSWKPFRKLALKKAEAWISERMKEGSGGLAAIYPAMLNSIIALKTLGYSNDYPLLQKARRDFEDLFVDDPRDFRIQPCLSPVWDTAITCVALAASGLDRNHPALKKASGWLAQKEVRTKGDWSFKNPHPEASGWAFEYDNIHYPDTDDTMMVLMALWRTGGDWKAGLSNTNWKTLQTPDGSCAEMTTFLRALRWLMSFQCRDGGWAAFDKDITQHWLEDVPFADHNAILDPSCSDLTGRVLELLGQIGFPKDDLRVRRAILLIQQTQETDGSWYGRWGVNYIYGTWQVLRGLRSIGEDMRQIWIVRARDWLQSCQNDDGGWGETCASYDDPKLKGIGPSTPSQTAWALMGLLAAVDPAQPGSSASKNIRHGVEFLITRQNADGSWPEQETTGTGFPSVFYLKYDMYRNNWPLLALAEFDQSGDR